MKKSPKNLVTILIIVSSLIIVSALVVTGVVLFGLLSPNPGSNGGHETEPEFQTESEEGSEYASDSESDSDSENESDTVFCAEHVFDEGIVTKEPTLFEEGILFKTCTVCGFELEVTIDKVEPTYVITLEGIGDYGVTEDGHYKLDDPEKVGFEFLGWLDADGKEFPSEGTVNKSVTVFPKFKLLDTKTVEELAQRAEDGAEVIRIANDIVIDRPIYVTSTTKIYSDTPVKLVRAKGYLGDLFVIGQNSKGENSILLNRTPALVLGNEDYTGTDILLTIDGNRNALEGSEVVGTAFFLINSSRVDMYNGVAISNHQKLGNERNLTISKYQIGTATTIGGSAVMIGAGSAFHMHGGIMENNSVRIDAVTLEDGTSSIPSGYGGAVYNNGTFRMYGGAIINCSANRGGAVYTDSVIEVTGGVLEGNYAKNKGGAICSSGSGGADIFIGVEGAEIGTVIFRNNSAGTQGGAILSYFDSPILLFGGVLFEGNSALGSNGGAISTSGTITSYGNSFAGNTAKKSGGAIYQTYASGNTMRIVEFKDTAFDGNSANSGGAIYITSTLKATDCIFNANTAKSGGALYIIRTSTVTDCSFTGNTVTYRGGAVYIAYSEELKNQLKVTIKGSIFTSNNATEGGDNEERRGGAIYVGEYNILNVSDSQFEDNRATQYGGAINGARGATISITNSKISGSNATNGGAIWIYSNASLSVTESNFVNNSANNGGAIYSYNTVNVTNTLFKSNTAKTGGALSVTAGAANTEGCTFESNTATSGGAVYVYGGTYVDGKSQTENSGSTFTDNVAYRGGAIYVVNDDAQTGIDKIVVNHATFSLNKATDGGSDEKRRGGAIYLAEYITATVNNSVFTENTATQYAGAIDVARGTTLNVNGSEFVKNTAASGGAIWIYLNSTVNIADSSFEENSSKSQGGAIHSHNVLNVLNTSFVGNSSASGGAICVADGVTTALGSEFDSNTATSYGGAIYVSQNTAFFDGSSEKAGSEFSKNTAPYGGAIYLASVEDTEKNPDYEAGKATLIGSKFTENGAKNYGGAIYVAENATLSAQSAIFNANTATRGGAVYMNGGEFTVTDSEFVSNIAVTPEGGTTTARGAAIFAQKGTIDATGVKFNDNSATSNGGAVVVNSVNAKAYLKNVEFNRNVSGGNGGALWLYSEATVEITGIVAKGNKAESGYGGFVYITEGTLTVHSGEGVVNIFGGTLEGKGNSAKNGAVISGAGTVSIEGASFVDNSAIQNGGALYITGTADIKDCSFRGNNAGTSGGVVYLNGTSLSLENVTVSENKSGIYLKSGALELSGRIVIKDNTDYDAYLTEGKLITVVGALDAESDIGFKKAAESGEIAKADGENVTSLSGCENKFFNNDGYPVFIGENGNLAYGFVIEEQPSVANEYTVTTIWQPTSYTWYFWIDGVKGDAVDGQNTATLTDGIGDQSYVCVLAYGDKTVETLPVTVKPAVVTQIHPICGSACDCTDITHEDVEWYPVANLDELNAAAMSAGNYYLTEDIVIDATVTVSADVNICLNGKKLSRTGTNEFILLSVSSGVTLTITDCNNDERAGYIDPDTGLWKEGVYSGEESAVEYKLYGGLITNGAGAGGRAVHVYGTLNTYGINFAGNISTDKASAIYVAGKYNDDSSVFVGNASAGQSGAIETAGGSTLRYTILAHNTSTTNRAGALLVTSKGIYAYGVTFKNNVAGSGHGGAVVVTASTVESVFENCTFEGNVAAENRAGAIYAYNSETVTTLSCTFINNSSKYGGAIYNTSTAAYVDGKTGEKGFGSTFKNNSSTTAGGAIYAVGNVDLYGSKFESNVAQTNGGAIYSTVTLGVTDCSFTSNVAQTNGGAIYLNGTKLSIVGVSITENNSGIYLGKGTLEASGMIAIENNTDYDLYLTADKYVTVIGALDSKASIGFTLASELGVVAKADGVNVTSLEEYAGVFFANNQDVVYVDDNGNIACGFSIDEQPSKLNGYTVTTSAQPDSYAWYIWADNARGEAVEGQNTATLTAGVANKAYICVISFGGKIFETLPVVFEVNVETQNHPICGSSCGCTDVTHEDIQWYPIANLDDLKAAAESAGNYYLTDDIVLDESIRISADVNICLNGKKLSASGNEAFSMLIVESGATLTLTDCGNKERAGYIDHATGLWTEGTHIGEETVIEYKLYGGLITNGAGGRAVYVYGTLNTFGINFAGNTASSGGAVYVEGRYNDVGSTFVGNAASNRGGAIYVAYLENVKNVLRLTLNSSTFVYNTATTGGEETTRRGGAIHIAEYIVAEIKNSVFNGNAATQYGGAISIARGSALSLSGSVFSNNNSGTNGGAMWFYTDATLNATDCEFRGNSTSSNGGAIYSYNTVTLESVEFYDNTAKNGGAIYSSGMLTLDKCRLESNVASSYGGAIYSTGSISSTDSDFTSNVASAEHGGAIYINGSGTLRVIGGTMKDNKTVKSKAGGAIAVYSNDDKNCPTAYISGTVFDGNSAYSGGAIALYNNDSANRKEHVIENITLINNKGGNGAVYIYNNTRVTVSGLVATNNVSTNNGSVFYVTSSNSPTLVVNDAVISGNSDKSGGIKFVYVANKSAVVDIYMDKISGDDFTAAGITDTTDINAEGWGNLIYNPNAGTVNGYVTPVADGGDEPTEQ